MPTLVIPCNLPMPREGIVNDHFGPTHSPYHPEDIVDFSATIGDGLGSDSTTGYLEADELNYEARVKSWFPTIGGAGIYFAGRAVSAEVTFSLDAVQSARSVAIARAPSGVHPPQLSTGFVDGGGAGIEAGSFPALSTDWQRLEVPWSVSTTIWDAFVEDIAPGGNGVSMELAPRRGGAFDPLGVVQAAWFAIEIDYSNAGMPPLRQVQRGDGLGSSVPRAVQTNSRQASLRSGRAFI